MYFLVSPSFLIGYVIGGLLIYFFFGGVVIWAATLIVDLPMETIQFLMTLI